VARKPRRRHFGSRASATIARLQAHAQLVGELDFILDGDTANYAALRKLLPAVAQPAMDRIRLRELLTQSVERERQRLVDEGRAAAEGPPALRWITLPANLGKLFLKEQLKAALTQTLSVILNRKGKVELWADGASQRDIAIELIDEPQVASDFSSSSPPRSVSPTSSTRRGTRRASRRSPMHAPCSRSSSADSSGSSRHLGPARAAWQQQRTGIVGLTPEATALQCMDQRRYDSLSGAERRHYDMSRELASL